MLKRAKRFPTTSGVYIFRHGGVALYVGKAANLKQRLASYFVKAEGRTPKVERMLEEATRLETIETASEIEALIKEAELIKQYRPKYNILMRDDKSYFYVAVTKEDFPRIYITHHPRAERLETRGQRLARQERKLVSSLYPLVSRYVGPFTGGSELHATLRLLRRLFPYCTCKRPHKRPCLNSEIGRCPGYCCTIAKFQIPSSKFQTYRREYRKNIQSIIAVLSGERTRLTGRLKREMREAVKRERYESAARLRDAVLGLEDVFAHRHVLAVPAIRAPWPIVAEAIGRLLGVKSAITRIEGYDISNIGGTAATGSMIVFTDGQPDKSEYRTFRIKTVGGSNDTAMLKEVLRRRLVHREWPYPDLMVIDGGKGQLNAARAAFQHVRDREKNETLQKSYMPILTALAKREEILFTATGRTIRLREQDPAVLHLFQRIRDESHRFARAYHHKLRARKYAESRSS